MTDLETIGILVKALELIESNPAHWDQSKWHCGTSHCLAGFCDIVRDYEGVTVDLSEIQYSENVSKFSITYPKLDYLFKSELSLRTLQTEIASLVERGEIDGYDIDGYDGDGYDIDGYNEDGYDIDGYDRRGYDEDRYDCYGYDSYGYNSDGYNEDGYDRRGYDKDGIKS